METFWGRLKFIVPGNFIGWIITGVDGKTIKNFPESYEVTNAKEIALLLGMSWNQDTPFTYVWVSNGNVLSKYLFKFSKIGEGKYKIESVLNQI